MSYERKITLIYFVLGIAVGFISKFLGNLNAVGIAVGVYVSSLILVRMLMSGKKLSWYILNSLLTFVLVWLITWVFVYNL